MCGIKIIELSPEKFESASDKNKYIADSQEKYLGFVNDTATDGEEAVLILKEYNMFENPDCQAVVFADRAVSDNNVTRAELMDNCDMEIFGIVFERSLLKKTGCFNNQLEGCCNLDFLCRLSEVTSICCIVCSADSIRSVKSGNEAKALAYLLRKYMTELKQSGCLDKIFIKITGYMQQRRLTEEFNNAVNTFLNDLDQYEKINRDTEPFFVIMGDETCYGVLKDFAGRLADALVSMGQAVLTSDENNDVNWIYNMKFKGIIGFQAIALMEKDAAGLKGKRLLFLFDHPAYFHNMLQGFSDGDYILCQDEDYASYVRKYYGVKNAIQFPPAGNNVGMPDFDNRSLDIVFVGTYSKPRNTDYKDEAQNTIYKYVTANPDLTIEQALSQLYGIEGNQLCQVMATLLYVRKNIVDYYRHKVVETIIAAGYQLHVYGDSWENFESKYRYNLIIHPQVTVQEMMDVYGTAKIGLNVMTWHKAGMTERIADIMLAGAVCLSDKTRYLCENFDNDEIALFDLKHLEELPKQIEGLLGDEKYRQRVARRGYHKAVSCHTWRKRAEKLCEMVEDIN